MVYEEKINLRIDIINVFEVTASQCCVTVSTVKGIVLTSADILLRDDSAV